MKELDLMLLQEQLFSLIKKVPMFAKMGRDLSRRTGRR